MIIIHFTGTIKVYAEAEVCPGRTEPLPDSCPNCGAEGELIRWGVYLRWGCTGEIEYHLTIQRVRCKACGSTHALIPDFLHPYRSYTLDLLYRVVLLYLVKGQGYGRIHASLPPRGPVYSTIQEWIASFAYGAGKLLLPGLVSTLTRLGIEFATQTHSPSHLGRVRNPVRQRHLGQAHYFLSLGERLYAWAKNRQARLHFAAESLFSVLLHWLQSRGLPPRIFWHEGLPGTPNTPF